MYLRLLTFLPAILIPARASSSLVFRRMYSAYKLNKQDDNVQPWCTPFPIWNRSIVPYLVLTGTSWPAYRFLRKQVRWSGTHISFRVFYSLLWPTQSKALTYWSSTWFSGIPLLFPCSIKCWNLISVSSASLKPSLYIWKFLVHILLKPSLKDFEHYFASLWNECNWTVAGTLFGIALLCGCCWIFKICCHIECISSTASSFRIWNISAGIPLPPLALFIVMLHKAHLTSHSRQWPHHHSYPGHEDLFCTVLCILATSS